MVGRGEGLAEVAWAAVATGEAASAEAERVAAGPGGAARGEAGEVAKAAARGVDAEWAEAAREGVARAAEVAARGEGAR